MVHTYADAWPGQHPIGYLCRARDCFTWRVLVTLYQMPEHKHINLKTSTLIAHVLLALDTVRLHAAGFTRIDWLLIET